MGGDGRSPPGADWLAQPAIRRSGPQIWGARVEPPSKTPGNLEGSGLSAAESGALGARDADPDPELATVIVAWPTLPAALKVGILAMVRAAK